MFLSGLQVQRKRERERKRKRPSERQRQREQEREKIEDLEHSFAVLRIVPKKKREKKEKE